MNKSIEEKFVNTFIVKDKRERILFELNSAKKRVFALRRLFQLLDKRFTVLEKRNIEGSELIAEIKKYAVMDNNCYIISDSVDDGKMLPLEVAIKNMLEYEMTYVIICDENTVVASEEYEICGTPTKMILNKNNIQR